MEEELTKSGSGAQDDETAKDADTDQGEEMDATETGAGETDGSEKMMSWSPRIPMNVRKDIIQLAEDAGCSIGTMFGILAQVYRTSQIRQRAADQEANIKSMERAQSQIQELFNNVLESWLKERERADTNEGAVGRLEKLQQELAAEKKAREDAECQLAAAEKKAVEIQTALETAKREQEHLSEMNNTIKQNVLSQAELQSVDKKRADEARAAAQAEVKKLQERLDAEKRASADQIRELQEKLDAAGKKAAKDARALNDKEEIIIQMQEQFLRLTDVSEKLEEITPDKPGEQHAGGDR